MNISDRPIGIFDSGVGGITVFKEIKKLLPGENIIYFGDTKHNPYGSKSKDAVTRLSTENVRFLLGKKVKYIVVACNTASALSLPFLKKIFSVPMSGVIEAGAKAALEITKNNDFWLPDQNGNMMKFKNENNFYYIGEFVGGKTGYLPQAKQTFDSIFNVNGRPIAIAVLYSDNRMADIFSILRQLESSFF